MTITIAIIQARMSSRRLPNKVLATLHSKPLMGYLIEGLKRSRQLCQHMLATSSDCSDDPVADYCTQNDIPFIRGPLDDVAARLELAVQDTNCEAFVRICADSPLLDYRLVDQAVDIYRSGDWDLVSNVTRRTFPKGQSVEVVRSATFRRILASTQDPLDREHVTRALYRCLPAERIRTIESGGDFGHIQLSVDTPADLERCRALIARMDRPTWEYDWRTLVEMVADLDAS